MTAKPRAASIQCLEDTDCAMLEKRDYEKVVGKAFKRKVQEKMDFLRNFRILSHMNEM